MSSDNPEPSSSKAAEVPPEPQIHVKASGNAILVSPRQVFKVIKNNF